jgi:DNA (cytosine-5)-methyltransferase 1
MRAGFEVLGIDQCPQPRYPSAHFRQIDAIDALRMVLDGHCCRLDAIHASPPCQRYCAPSQYNHNRDSYPDYIPALRELLEETRLPYVIENTPGAPLREPVILCGTMFGLSVYRHRLFESNRALHAPEHPTHAQLCSRNGALPTSERPMMTVTGGKHSRAWTRTAAEAMGVEWMQSPREVCEAIPPAYTHYIGEQLMAHLNREKVA